MHFFSTEQQSIECREQVESQLVCNVAIIADPLTMVTKTGLMAKALQHREPECHKLTSVYINVSQTCIDAAKYIACVGDENAIINENCSPMLS